MLLRPSIFSENRISNFCSIKHKFNAKLIVEFLFVFTVFARDDFEGNMGAHSSSVSILNKSQ